MSLVERLGFHTLTQLYNAMDSNDIMEWAAYDMLKDEKWVEKNKLECEMEAQRGQSLEEEARLMRAMIQGLGS